MGDITLVLGGARSGKSLYAEQRLLQSTRRKLYVATARLWDEEMVARVAAHQARRGAGWQTVEVPLELPEKLLAPEHQDAAILVDCLTLWISNLMHHHQNIPARFQALLEALQRTQAEIVLVSNEVGQGIVPDNALARQFRDHAGLLHQQIAQRANRVVFVTAGLPQFLKGQAG